MSEVNSMKITVVGSINIDYSVTVNRLPKEGETLMAKSFSTIPGGKGANQAVAAKRLGAEVSFIGAVGSDPAGQKMIEHLINEGIDVRGIKVVSDATGTALIAVSEEKENQIIVYPGANWKADQAHIKHHEELIAQCDILLIQLELPVKTVVEAVALAKKYGKMVILNPAPANELPKELFDAIDVITPNETELKVLTGLEDIEAGARHLLDLGVKKVVVTLGAKGCFYMDASQQRYFKGYSVDDVDPTAAGDTFNGALAVRYKLNLDETIAFASGAAALATTKLGAQTSIPRLHEVLEFIESQYCRTGM